MAPGKLVPVTMPIESAMQPKAPATVPFWRYDEDAGLWIPLGNLTRSGNRYLGQVNHFSAFNADTQFGGSACLKVILDPASFTLPVYLASLRAQIQGYACGTGSPATQGTRTFAMPHAEVPFKRFWTDSLGSTLASMLSLPAPGCPNH